jgi:hypothetical protein
VGESVVPEMALYYSFLLPLIVGPRLVGVCLIWRFVGDFSQVPRSCNNSCAWRRNNTKIQDIDDTNYQSPWLCAHGRDELPNLLNRSKTAHDRPLNADGGSSLESMEIVIDSKVW